MTNVVAEFNQFCKGDHPCYSGRAGTSLIKFDGSKGTKELRIRDKNQRAHYFRDGDNFNINRLVLGATKRAPESETADDFYYGLSEEGSINMVKETIDQYLFILDVLKKRSTMAI